MPFSAFRCKQYVVSAPDQTKVIEGLIAFECEEKYVSQAVGVVGAVIMPHNLYLHSALVVSRAVNRRSKVAVSEANKYNSIDSTIAICEP